MSTPDPETVADLVTRERLRSYIAAPGNDIGAAVELYEWNSAVSGASYEDIGRFEIVFRNTLDAGLAQLGARKGWSSPWYLRQQLFPGRHGARALKDIATARKRATRNERVPEAHGKVIAELSFGFWRFLSSQAYLTSLWVPALAGQFLGHPDASDPRVIRREVEDRVQRIHFLRNRVAHHEPIHRRTLQQDHHDLLQVLAWIRSEAEAWVRQTSRVPTVLAARP
jgi:hypothetical protein